MSSYSWSPLGGGASGVQAYTTTAFFPVTGSTGIIYIALDTENLYLYDEGTSSYLLVGGPGAALALGNFDSQPPTAKGAELTGGVLSMQSATTSFPGLVNTTTQSFAGNKTFTGNISAANLSGTNTGDVTIGTANGLSLVGQVLSMSLADGSTIGSVSTGTQTFAGAKTFSSSVTVSGLLNADGGIDRSTAGTLTIGATNSTTINIGNSGATVNIQGTTIYENTPQLLVADPLITLNTGGGAGSGQNAGIQIEEAASITGYAETSSDRNSWIFKAPNTTGVSTLTPGAGADDILLSAATQNVSNKTINSSSIGSVTPSTGDFTALSSTGAVVFAPIPATVDRGLLNAGSGAFDGLSSGRFVGSANGTDLALNAASGFTGNLADFQLAGVSKFLVTAAGDVTATSFLGNGTVFGLTTARIPFAASAVTLADSPDLTWNPINYGLQLNTTNTTTDNAFQIRGGPFASATRSMISLGPANIVGGTAAGTFIGVNAAAAYAGDFINLQTNGVAKLRVTSTGAVTGIPSINPTGGTTLTLNGSMTSTTGSAITLANNTLSRSFTSGTGQHVLVSMTYAPTSGTGVFSTEELAPTINQTGGANGITRGLFVNPTLTSAADWRSIETAIGNTVLGSTSGNTGIGVTAPTASLHLRAGTTTLAPLKFTSGTNLTTPEAGTIEYDGTDLFFTPSTVRQTVLTTASTVAIANGGTGQTTASAAFNALSPMTTGGDLIYGGASGAGTRLANGTAGQYLASAGGTSAPAWTSFIAPTINILTSSGTYTVPANTKYLIVRMVGGGGGGAGSGSASSSSDGTNGGDTTFGSSLLTATGGGGGVWSAVGNGGVGGTATVNSPATSMGSVNGATGGGGAFRSISTVQLPGANGGSSFFGGAGAGGGAGSAGNNAVATTGSGGGGGASGNAAANVYSGASGGAGAYIHALIASPGASYAYSVGAAGTGGSAGTDGVAGGNGATGTIIVEAHFN